MINPGKLRVAGSEHVPQENFQQVDNQKQSQNAEIKLPILWKEIADRLEKGLNQVSHELARGMVRGKHPCHDDIHYQNELAYRKKSEKNADQIQRVAPNV